MYGSDDFPQPVVRDSKGPVADYTELDWVYRVREELDEALAADNPEDKAEEIVDAITVCISWLNSRGYGEKDRVKKFRKVNKKNKQRGYDKPFLTE